MWLTKIIAVAGCELMAFEFRREQSFRYEVTADATAPGLIVVIQYVAPQSLLLLHGITNLIIRIEVK